MNHRFPPLTQIAGLFLLLLFTACQSFPKGYRLMLQGEEKKAIAIFEKRENHPTYGSGARYYKEILNLRRAHTLQEWNRIHNVFCDVEDRVKKLPAKKIHKLAKYNVRPVRIRESMENLEVRVLAYLCQQGTIADLDSVYAHFPCWIRTPARDSMRILIVNRTIDPHQPVFPAAFCSKWVGPDNTDQLPTIEQLVLEKDRACISFKLRDNWTITYDEAASIVKNHDDAVLEVNYGAFWNIQDNIWELFTIQHSYCDMPGFKTTHPDDNFAQDCWFDQAYDTLCLGQLKPLLAFHQNNRHTILDFDVCNQILCLSRFSNDTLQLNAAERKQVADVRLMHDLQEQFICRVMHYDSLELIEKVAYLAREYPQHRVVYNLAREMANYFFTTGRLKLAHQAADTLTALFPDKYVCPTDFDFQTRKQKWFANYAGLLKRAGDSLALVEPMRAWNTPDNNEYGLISWAENEEVFFVRRNRETAQAQVMTSKLGRKGWTKPAEVRELSIANDILPLSMSADGRLMLLRSGGRLLQAYRHDTRRPWSTPDPFPMYFSFNGKAMLSPDGTTLVLEDYTGQTSALQRPRKDIFVSKLEPNGAYGRPVPVGKTINLPKSDEANPIYAVGGRMLIYTSDQDESLGYSDLYSVVLEKAGDWSTAAEPMNMGLQVNTIFNENGLSYFSDYSGEGYFDRLDKCTGDRDIYRIPVAPEVFPQNAMRLAGLILDENRQPITGGFMEFTTDYNLRAQSTPISAKGTYTYTTPDNTEVVRLFPELAGYYSENDTTHFLAHEPKGKIIRDTFVLTSFEYIRQKFELRHSTFINGTAVFDNPLKAYPELTRLAKIATRMGAELELVGHTDSTGTEGDNFKLAIDRATSVKLFLVEKCGFDSNKIKVDGFGPTRPRCSNATEEGRRCNRRVEVIFRMPVLPSKQNAQEKTVVKSQPPPK